MFEIWIATWCAVVGAKGCVSPRQMLFASSTTATETLVEAGSEKFSLYRYNFDDWMTSIEATVNYTPARKEVIIKKQKTYDAWLKERQGR